MKSNIAHLLFNMLYMNADWKNTKAGDIVKNHVGYATTAALIPLPGADIAAVSAVQLNMLRQLAGIYNVKFMDGLGKNIITALISGSASRLLASGVKLIPGIGTLIGELTMPIMAGASTYALGQVLIKHLEQGGTLENFDPIRAKSNYDKAFKQGEAAAKAAAEKATPSVSDDDVVEKLKKIAALRDAGVLSEEEFKEMKNKLIAQL